MNYCCLRQGEQNHVALPTGVVFPYADRVLGIWMDHADDNATAVAGVRLLNSLACERVNKVPTVLGTLSKTHVCSAEVRSGVPKGEVNALPSPASPSFL